MSKTKFALPKSGKLRNPYQVRDGLNQLVHALSVVFSGWGG
ncbi:MULTISPECIES: hypothetical protein [Amycolatopsis]|nr:MULTISPECIES: hypothetical protein [Amycolatopsis]